VSVAVTAIDQSIFCIQRNHGSPLRLFEGLFPAGLADGSIELNPGSKETTNEGLGDRRRRTIFV
jgi:hypothetical protein